MIVCVCERMRCLCLWHVAKSRGTEDLVEGVSMRQGEWRDAIEGGILAFPFVNMKVSVFCKNLVSTALFGSHRSVKSASQGPHPALCRGASQAECSGTS